MTSNMMGTDNVSLLATIVLPDETYHIEPSWRHLPDSTSHDRHMVAYRASDVKLSWENNDRQNHEVTAKCGYVKEGLELETDDEDEEDEEVKAEAYGGFFQKTLDNLTGGGVKRKKRQADQYEYTPTKTRCPLLLVADYRFFQEMGSSNTKTTISYLVNSSILNLETSF